MATKKRPITTNAAFPSIGSHSQAIRCGDLVFLTGQTGRDPANESLPDTLEAQAEGMLKNVEAILNAAGCSRRDIVKVTLIMSDIKTFKAVDQIYASWIPDKGESPMPARTAFEATALPAGAKVMIDVIAAYPADE